MYYAGINQPRYYYDFYSGRIPLGPPVDCVKACQDCERCGESTFTQKMCTKDCEECTLCMISTQPMTDGSQLLSRNYSPINECVSTCGMQACVSYHRQMGDYRRCLKTEDKLECQKKYGCRVWNNSKFRYAPPIDPRYTGCNMCWRSGFTVLN